MIIDTCSTRCLANSTLSGGPVIFRGFSSWNSCGQGREVVLCRNYLVFLLSLTKQTVFIGKMYIKRKCDMVKCNLVSYFCHHHYNTSLISFLSRNVSINNLHFSAHGGAARNVQLLKPVPDGGF